MSNKVKNLIVALIIATACLTAVHFVFAQVDVGIEYGENIGITNADPRDIAVNIIRVALGFLGIIAVGLILYAGFLWMTSAGNEAKIDQAKRVLKGAGIGLIIILSSFGITVFLFGELGDSMFGGGGGGGPGGGGGGLSALGNGVIESHYPGRYERDLPRNTPIVVTFKEPIDPSTIISGGQIDADNIIIYPKDNPGSPVTNVNAATDDNKTFFFDPVEYLGSPSEYMWYIVELSTGITKGNGDPAFPGAIGIGYSWTFEVGTYIDVTPPKIISIVPQPGNTEPRNVVIQINFNEAINPLSAAGELDIDPGSCSNPPDCTIGTAIDPGSFSNINVFYPVPAIYYVAGIFYISNQYRTVEFLTEDMCGVNSCGDDVYCLPGNAALQTLIKAAGLIAPPEPTGDFNTGVTDMAGNSLDGNADGVAQGPGGNDCELLDLSSAPYCDPASYEDDAFWAFNTDNTIDIGAPAITAINPGIGAAGVTLNAVPEATFNKLLISSSLNTTNISINDVNYWISKSDNMAAKETSVYINHDQFDEDMNYTPRYLSGIRDIYQNCYSPAGGMSCTGSGGPSCCEGVWDAGSSCP